MEGVGLQLHSFLFSATDGRERSTPIPGRFIPIMNAATHWIVNWLGPRAGMDVVQTRIISLPCRDSNPGPSSLRQNYNFCEKPNISNGMSTNNKQYLHTVNTTPRTTLRDTCLWRGVCCLCRAKSYFDLICKSIRAEEPGVTNVLSCLEFTPMSVTK